MIWSAAYVAIYPHSTSYVADASDVVDFIYTSTDYNNDTKEKINDELRKLLEEKQDENI